MDGDEFHTPRKFVSCIQARQVKYSGSRSSETPHSKRNMVKNVGSHSKQNVDSMNFIRVGNTPPNFSKIMNPFEPGLTERLHLPLICSPSLFQRGRTPRQSLSHFEWTIDEVSSLNPVNVEPNELQFQPVSDPELDAKAQAAINSYFKEQVVVPSPVECSLRKQKIHLSPDIDKNSGAKSVQRVKDGICQTELTFPPKLPLDIENVFKKFCTYTRNQQQNPLASDMANYSIEDTSLRRKLFEYSIHVDDEIDISTTGELKTSSPAPTTPELNLPRAREYSFDSLTTNDTGLPSSTIVDKSFFGSLSPIAKCRSSNESSKSVRKKHENLNVSDTQRSGGVCSGPNEFSSNDSVCVRSTPERAEDHKEKNYSSNNSSEIRLKNTKEIETFIGEKGVIGPFESCNQSINSEECNDMQFSQLSAKSANSSSSSKNAHTPVRKRRSANRKNLSQSFSCHSSDVDDENDKDESITMEKFITIEIYESSTRNEPTNDTL